MLQKIRPGLVVLAVVVGCGCSGLGPDTNDNNAVCGNGVLEAPEACDGTLLDGQTCQTRGYIGGTLLCSAIICQFSERECDTGPVCGDAHIGDGEQCDGVNLNGETCVLQGFEGGTLGCTSECLFDTASCY